MGGRTWVAIYAHTTAERGGGCCKRRQKNSYCSTSTKYKHRLLAPVYIEGNINIFSRFGVPVSCKGSSMGARSITQFQQLQEAEREWGAGGRVVGGEREVGWRCASVGRQASGPAVYATPGEPA